MLCPHAGSQTLKSNASSPSSLLLTSPSQREQGSLRPQRSGTQLPHRLDHGAANVFGLDLYILVRIERIVAVEMPLKEATDHEYKGC